MCDHLKKLYLVSLKYIPLVQTFVLICCIINKDSIILRYIVELLFGCSVVSGLRLLASSKMLNFCVLHRVIIFYNCYSFIIIKLRQIFGVSEIFLIMKPFHIVLGILLLIYAVIDKVIFKNNKSYKNFKHKLLCHK